MASRCTLSPGRATLFSNQSAALHKGRGLFEAA